MVNKCDIIKNIIEQKFINDGFDTISNVQDMSHMAKKILSNKSGNMVFEKSYLFSLFAAELKFNNQQVKLINCSSSIDRLNKDLQEAEMLTGEDDMVVYYNVGNCTNVDVISKIINKQSILCL